MPVSVEKHIKASLFLSSKVNSLTLAHFFLHNQELRSHRGSLNDNDKSSGVGGRLQIWELTVHSTCVSGGAFQQLIQVFCKQLERKRPPADNNHNYTQTVTAWTSEVCPLIMTDLMLGLLSTSTLHLSLD